MSRESIAIVRVASLFPGALDAASYWDNVRAGRSAIRDVPAGRWPLPVADVYDATAAPDRAYSRAGGFVEGFSFDPAGLRVDAALARDLDPLFQWVLHVGRTLTDGATLPREKTGVVLANLVLPSDTFVRLGNAGWRTLLRSSLGSHADAMDTVTRPNLLNHFQAGLPAGLLARALDLHGGTVALDAACASSLYAIKLACDQLQTGRADAMIAGGVARVDHLTLAIGFSQLRAISKSGRSRPFDAGADGLVPGEGCGMVLLRRLSDAQARGEEVLAVIRAVGLANDGKGRGTLMPSSEGQVRSLHAAYREAGFAPHTVGHVECHATGTTVGDAAEITTMKTVWGPDAPRGGTALGSVKSMVGHLLAAAGAAGTIKSVFALRNGELPPTLNFEHPSPGTEVDGSPLFISTTLRKWEQPSGPRRAAVSAFGFGGCNAHLVLEEAPARPQKPVIRPPPRIRTADEPIAVVAMNARMGELDVDAYRRLVFEAQSALKPVPAARWMGLADPPVKPVPGTFIDRLGSDDPMKLRIPPLEIERMLTQQLLSLLVAEEMLGDGKLLGRTPDRMRVGVVVGMAMEADAGNHAFRWSMQSAARHETDPARAAWLRQAADAGTVPTTAECVLGFLANLIANRISSRFDLGGPSLSIAAEDASALKAIEVAAPMLGRGDADAMIVGAVDLPADIRSVLVVDEVQGFTRGEVRPFDKRADGTAAGEAAGLFLLKRLSDATAAGDTILAVIKGVGASHDGADGDVGQPGARGYAEALQRACDDAGAKPSSLGLVVVHGSGRPAEDMPEMVALREVFGTPAMPHAAIHAPKAVVGHAGAASGVASLVSAILSLRHRAVPPTRGLEDPALPDAWKGSAFYVARKARPWLTDDVERPRRADVATMSVDGNHVHVILEEGPIPATTSVLARPPEALFLFRGATRADIAGEVRAWRPAVAGADVERLAMARAAAHRRGKMPLTLAVVAADGKDLEGKLDKALAFLAGNAPEMMDIHGLFFSEKQLAVRGKTAFVFPGAGNAYAGMARELVLRFPELMDGFVRKTVTSRTCAQEHWLHPREIFKHKVSRDEMRSAQEMMWGAGYYTQMLADAIRHRLGITPDAAMGYSLGETTSLFALEAWNEIDDLYHRNESWPLINTEIAGPMDAVLRDWARRGVDVAPLKGTAFWSTWLLVCSPGDVEPLLKDEPLVHLAIINAPDECVIAGSTEGCKRIIEKLKCSAHFTPFPVAIHVPEVNEVVDEYRRMHTLPTRTPAGITYYSSGTGRPYAVNEAAAAQSIVSQGIRGVDFPRLIKNVHDDGVRIFVEVGPRGSCTRWVNKILEGREFWAVATDRKGRSEFVNLLHLAAQLAAHGHDIDLEKVYSASVAVPERVVPRTRREYLTVRALQVPPPPPKTVVVVEKPIPRTIPSAKHRTAVPAPLPSPPAAHFSPLAQAPVPTVSSRPRRAPPMLRAPVDSVAAAEAPRAVTRPPMETAIAVGPPPEVTYAPGDPVSELVSGFNRMVTQLAETHRAFLENARVGNVALTRLMLAAAGQAVKPAVFTREQIVEHGLGTPSRLWGPDYAVFDHDRRMARLPNGPYLCLDRITEVGQPARQLEAGAWLVGEYDVPPSAWYFDANGHPTMPFGVLLEVFLQPCGFLSSYMGADLRCAQDRRFRNLGGKAVLHREVTPGGSTLITRAVLKKFSEYGDMLVVDFDVVMTQDGATVMEGSSYFGFFTDEALGQQKGLQGKLPPFNADALPAPIDVRQLPGLARPPLIMMDRLVALDPAGGRPGRGYARAEKDVNPDEWFFKAHFHQDPVTPGSLGVEGMLQLMQLYMQARMGVDESHRFEPVATGRTWEWTYRGQVVRHNSKVCMELEVVNEEPGVEPVLTVDAYLSVDGLGIYRLDGVGMRALKRR